MNKRGAVEEMGKIVLAIVILVLLVATVIILFKGKGGELLATVKDFLRFGRA